jgi:hypothetical protein
MDDEYEVLLLLLVMQSQMKELVSNFIVDERESDTEDQRYFSNFSIDMNNPIQQALTRKTGELPRAVVTDNNEPLRRGRPTIEEGLQREIGIAIRDRLTVALASNDMRRPMQHDMKYNNNGNIIITS